MGIRAVPIAEAMLAIVVMDHLLRHRGQNHGVTTETPIRHIVSPGNIDWPWPPLPAAAMFGLYPNIES